MNYGLVWGCDPDDDSGRVIQPPNWANNPGAALALCLEIAMAYNMTLSLCSEKRIGSRRPETSASLILNAPRSLDEAFNSPMESYTPGDMTSLATALARLALAALL